MSITVDLNGAAGGTSAITAFTEQTMVSLFPSAIISTNGSPDSNSIDTVTITLASATVAENLSLNAAASSAATAAGITVNYNSGTGVLTLSGSDELTSQWQTILQGVQYNNTSNSPTGPTRTVTVVATNTGTSNSSSATDTINITAVNDAPVATITPTSYSATEQTSLNLKNNGLSISDVDAGSSSVSVTLSVTEGALNVAAGTSGATVSNSGTSSVTITGTVAQINALLSTNATSTVSYIDNTDAPGASATLTLNVNDNGNTGGGALQSSDTATINITAVNDAPVATITPTSYSATEQTSLNLKNTGLSIGDVDAGSSSVSATLSVTEGALNVAAGTSGATVSNSGTSSVTITGTVAQINALLSTNATSTVSYIDNTDAPGASATLTLNVNDNGNTGGGALQSSDTATINITAVNDAPVATITPTSYSATEQTSLNLKNTGLSISDVDAGSSSVSATLSVTEGALNVAAGTSGATVSNSGTSSVTIIGTVAQINALLSTNATSTVSYIDNTDAPGASATLTLNVNDNGNTGGGALQSSDTATINITAVNDAAVLSADVSNLTETDTAADISTAGTLTVSDVDSPASFVAQAATVGSYGTFAIDTAGAWTYTASSAHNEFAAGTTYTDTFSVASADGTLSSVTINILGTNDAAVALRRRPRSDRDQRGPCHLRHAHRQRRRQPRQLRGAGRHRRQLRHLRHRCRRRLDLHRQLGAQRVCRRHHLHRHLLGRQRRRHPQLGHHQHPRHQRRRGALRRRQQSERDQRGRISTSGTLTVSDVDSPATFVAQAATVGSYGTFAIDTAGAWTYTASSAHNEFVDGTTYTDTFSVASADGTLSSVTINILGTNDAAVLSADVRDLSETDTAAAFPPPARSPSATSTAPPASWRRPPPSAATAPSPSMPPAPGPTPPARRTTSLPPAPPTPTPSRSPAPTAPSARSPSTSSAPTTPRCSPPTSAI